MSRVNPYLTGGRIESGLPLARTPAPITGSPAELQGSYNRAYDSALAQNQALYDRIRAGYEDVAAGQRTAQEAMAAGYPALAARIRETLGGAAAENQAGYGRLLGENRYIAGWGGESLNNLYNRQRDFDSRYQSLQDAVMGDISRIGGAQRMNIEEDYARARGAAEDDLAARGLGNTTVRSSVLRGVEFDRARAGNELAERVAGLNAQYRSSLGLAGLTSRERSAQQQIEQERLNQRTALDANASPQMAALAARERAAGQMAGYDSSIGLAGLAQDARNIDANTGLARDQLNWMNSVTAAYPDARAYQNAAALAAMQAAGVGAAPTRGGYDFGNSGGMTRVPGSGGTVPTSGGYVGSGVRAPGFDFGQAFSSTGYIPPSTLSQLQGGHGAEGGDFTGGATIGAPSAAGRGAAPAARSGNPYGAGRPDTAGGAGLVAPSGTGLQPGGAFQGPYGRGAAGQPDPFRFSPDELGAAYDTVVPPDESFGAGGEWGDPLADVPWAADIIPELWGDDGG